MADRAAEVGAFEALREGGKPALAQALARLERSPDDPALLRMLDGAYGAPSAHVIGLTGPPGVGKSTLAGALISAIRLRGRTLGVIAVDPTSRVSGGALLGDRTRIRADPGDDGVFVRSMAARDRLGGLADLSYGAMVLMRALFDVVLVETVGIGQSETEVALVADTIVFCVQPGSGDSLQYMKAGIAEIPDIVAITKSDLGSPAIRAQADVKGALGLSLGAPDDWQPKVLIVSAQTGDGMDDLLEALEGHWQWLAQEDRLERRRAGQARAWLELAIKERWGSEGLKKRPIRDLAIGASPFAWLSDRKAP